MAKTLLVADDSATMRRVVELTFAGEEVQVVTAPSGEAALQKAREVRPDVVLADAQMGAMSGYELCRALKADGSLRAIPVIVMASQHTPYDESLGRDVGADDHCIKPFDSQALIDKVRNAAARAPARPAAPPPTPAAAQPPAPSGAALTPPPTTMQPGARPAAPPAAATVKVPAAPPPPPSPPTAAPPRPAPAAPPAPAPDPSLTAAAPAAPIVVSEAGDSAAAQAMAKATAMGLSPDQASAVARLTKEVVERVVWEVVPDLAETIIREEIRRLTQS